MTIDREGLFFSARWDGFGLFKYDRQGRLLDKIPFPVAKVSSAIFGGPTLEDLYVTTAGGDPASGSADGTLYRIRGAGQGVAEFRSRILMQKNS